MTASIQDVLSKVQKLLRLARSDNERAGTKRTRGVSRRKGKRQPC